jgi:hypothetical protein
MTIEVRRAVAKIADRNGWDGSAIYALISLETGGTFAPDAGHEAWSPSRTATGLLQFTEGTLGLLNVPPTSVPHHAKHAKHGGKWRTWNIMGWPVEYQVELVERFFVRSFEKRRPARPVDYYLAAWGAAPGLPMSTVLAVRGDKLYGQNSVLDIDGDGTIRVSDLAKLLARRMRELATAPKEPAKIDAGLTVPGVIVTLGFQVLRRRMLLA